jgi:hypothetical protein
LVVRITKLGLRKSDSVDIIHDFFSPNSVLTKKVTVLACKEFEFDVTS